MSLFLFTEQAGCKLSTTTEQDAESALREHLTNSGLGNPDLQISLEGQRVIVSGMLATQADKEKVVLALGNVAGVNQVAEAVQVAMTAPEARFVTVAVGDTLRSIAEQEYGNPDLGLEILAANQPLLAQPDSIYPGLVLRVP